MQATDVEIPERGLPFVFTRTYNSKSQHNANNWDKSGAAIYGNSWTNTFDAHLSYDPNAAAGPTMHVWDATGARYDYVGSNGAWVAPAGTQGSSLTYDGACRYYWTQKDGSQLYFYGPTWDSCMSNTQSALDGRLYEIIGRNSSNYIKFNYGFTNGDASSINNLTQILATHQDGQSLTLTFALIGGTTGPNELSTIALPGGNTVTYNYGSAGGLISVQHLGNGGANAPQETYTYGTNGTLTTIVTPNANATITSQPGDTIGFSYDSSKNVLQITNTGAANFTPADNTNTPLQNGSTSPQTWRTQAFSGWSTNVTEYSDTDGHANNWTEDSAGRVTQTASWGANNGSSWLVTSDVWGPGPNDANRVVKVFDTNNNEYDAEYDVNGNLAAIAEPLPSSQWSYRPTSLATYDQFNNLKSYCDPVETHAMGADWGASPPAIGACKAAPGAQVYNWDFSDSNEPFGRLVSATDANGNYTVSVAYNNYGLPNQVQGGQITQAHGGNITPTETLGYDGAGNVTSVNNGVGITTAAYNNNTNRLVSVTDADGVKSYIRYYPNGQVECTDSALQYHLDNGVTCGANAVSYTYDADGNNLTETHHYNSVAGVTTRYYDPGDRLVEVALPHDASDLYATLANSSPSWLTRYLYSINGVDQPVSVNNSNGVSAFSFYNYGSMYKVQRYVPQAGQTTGFTWQDVKANANDALGRITANYVLQPGGTFHAQTVGYDGSFLGLASTWNAASGGNVQYGYDSLGNMTSETFDVVGNVTESYDADSRPISYYDANVGTASFSYDKDGNLVTYQEPNGGNGNPWINQFSPGSGASLGTITSPSQFTYTYQGGLMTGFTLTGAGLTAGPYTREYGYRTDRSLSYQSSTYNGVVDAFTQNLSNAGRLLQKSDPVISNSLSVNYDTGSGSTNTGTITSWAIPQGSYSAFTYDPEGDVTGYTAPDNSVATMAYSVRGELLNYSLNKSALVNEISADGFMTTPGKASGFDPRIPASTAVSYDQDGRTTGYIYDALSRFYQVAAGYEGWPVYMTYGAGTLPLQEAPTNGGSNSPTYTYHNSIIGSESIYTTAANGSIADIQYAHDMDDGAVWDRDMFGYVVGAHTATEGVTPWSGSSPYSSCSPVKTSSYAQSQALPTQSQCANAVGLMFAFRTDGYYDGVVTWRGARAYSGSSQQWTTADTYQGDPASPGANLPYNYANNNPFMYQDPSGFCSGVAWAPIVGTGPDGSAISGPNMQQFSGYPGPCVPTGYGAGGQGVANAAGQNNCGSSSQGIRTMQRAFNGECAGSEAPHCIVDNASYSYFDCQDWNGNYSRSANIMGSNTKCGAAYGLEVLGAGSAAREFAKQIPDLPGVLAGPLDRASGLYGNAALFGAGFIYGSYQKC